MTTTYSTPGISCEHCRGAITGEVGQIAGVDAAVRDAIDNAGYDISA